LVSNLRKTGTTAEEVSQTHNMRKDAKTEKPQKKKERAKRGGNLFSGKMKEAGIGEKAKEGFLGEKEKKKEEGWSKKILG